jgi:hypothetical protein
MTQNIFERIGFVCTIALLPLGLWKAAELFAYFLMFLSTLA